MTDLTIFAYGALTGSIVVKSWKLFYRIVVVIVGFVITFETLIKLKKKRPKVFIILASFLIILICCILAGFTYISVGDNV